MLEDFLYQKPLFYDEIDYLRMPRVYGFVKSKIKLPKIIHIIGTNGKGTTGRFLASALYAIGYQTGHYTSPHILNFNERIWINDHDISDTALEMAHQELLKILHEDDAKSLSYFEYTTLLALWLFQDLEYVILEAGLGGEHDATAVFKNILTVVTPIDKDHEAFLGTTIKEIATTKLNAVQTEAIVAKQIHEDVYNVLAKNKIKNTKSISLLQNEDSVKIEQIASSLFLADYLKENLTTAVATLKFLQIDYETKHFLNSRLFGRLTQFKDNILLDVGHNKLAAQAIFKTLQPKKYRLIYNSYKDKDYNMILKILKPIIECVEIIDIVDKRAVQKSVLQETLQELDIVSYTFEKISNDHNYLVFGSFSVVEAFLKGYSE